MLNGKVTEQELRTKYESLPDAVNELQGVNKRAVLGRYLQTFGMDYWPAVRHRYTEVKNILRNHVNAVRWFERGGPYPCAPSRELGWCDDALDEIAANTGLLREVADE